MLSAVSNALIRVLVLPTNEVGFRYSNNILKLLRIRISPVISINRSSSLGMRIYHVWTVESLPASIHLNPPPVLHTISAERSTDPFRAAAAGPAQHQGGKATTPNPYHSLSPTLSLRYKCTGELRACGWGWLPLLPTHKPSQSSGI